MKYLLLINAFFFVFGTAQSDAYEEDMQTAITLLENAEADAGKYFEMANQFEALSKIKPDDWHPVYYEALSYAWSAFAAEDVSSIDSTLDVAASLLESCARLGGDKSEIRCVQSMIASARILVDPKTRGMKYGMQSNELIQEALAANPNNPRIYLVQAQGRMYTPEIFGGGCKGAEPFINLSLEKFAVYKPVSGLSPSWGLKDAKTLQTRCE